MTTVSEDTSADLKRQITELERRLDTALIERDAAIDRQTASALVNFRLQNELRGALDRQKAGAEILRSIAATAGDAEHALQTIADTTLHFFNAASVTIRVAQGDEWVQTVRVGASAQLPGAQPAAQFATRGANLPATVYQENRQIHVPDLDNIDPSMAAWPMLAAREGGIRTLSGTPLRREGKAIGALLVYRDRPVPFTPEELALQQNFADQAVIAIENARLFNDTQEALARQTATADVLRVISGSPTDVQPVFDAIVQAAVRLLGCETAFIQRCDGAHFWSVARCRREEGLVPVVASQRLPIDRNVNFPSRAIVDKATLYLPDWSKIEIPEFERRIQEALGYQSAVYLPLLREGECIGVLGIAGSRPRMFGETEIALAESFCDQAVIAIENARLFNETQEALARQTATTEVLQVINSSPGNLAPVFDAILEKAHNLCGAAQGSLQLYDGSKFRAVAVRGLSEAFANRLREGISLSPDAPGPHLLKGARFVQIPDLGEMDDPMSRAAFELAGIRTVLFIPLRKDGILLGRISASRAEVKLFTEKEIGLLESFAAQAVIAIENARLFNETQEALERQTATADILKVIASSPVDVQPVFDAIAERSNTLFGGLSTAVYSLVGNMQHLMAFTSTSPAADAALRSMFPRPVSEVFWSETIRKGEIFRIANAEVELATLPSMRELARLRGWQSALLVPLMRNQTAIGYISVTRAEPGPFTDHDVQLLKTFADQAVIAIENTRLFNETQQALERQTATADILKVIASSPSDVQPVFEAIATRAKTLVGGFSSTVFRFIDGIAHLMAFTPTTPEADEILTANFPNTLDSFAPFQIGLTGEVAQIPDTESLTNEILHVARARGFRSMLCAPLMNKGESIGLISVTRTQPGTFADHHVQLLQTFADQAVIAIENTRLFNEVQAKTRDLEESLQQQTATADVLKVISRSVFDLQTVLDTLVESAYQLCGARLGLLYLKGEEAFECKAVAGLGSAEASRQFKGRPIRAGRGTAAERVILTGEVHCVENLLEDPEIDPAVKDMIRNAGTDAAIGGARSTLAVPMTRDNTVIGVLVVVREETGPFPARQVEILQTFADQAVIAIENVRLFDEVQARTRDLTESLQQQTATSEVLKVISSSPGELGPVFRSMLENAVTICDAQFGNLLLVDGDRARWEAGVGTPPKLAEFFTRSAWFQPTPGSHVHRVMRTKQVSHTVDDLAEPVVGAAARLGGARSTVCVPMVKDDVLLGTIFIYRTEVRPFTDKQIDLVKNFAAQAVIAIENTRLLKELRQRTDDLTKSLDDLRTAQDRLIQTEKLASLGQLTAGIAHEIKNPLNFVNNFAALSSELTDELKDALKPAVLDETIRAEVDELTGLLKDNLGKVVQHGKRADSIVKNMLLHSREGSGDHRPADVNALVEESLNLAYHGARAEKPQFNVTLKRDFDPDAGMIEAFPQEITRVLLNLISNGFYAVAKRQAENGDGAFEPVVSATTKGRGDHVEIRIRDNGTGIPPDVREKMFNPFFTTKPAGEGTGLGLSMSHDIIVKQHGGTIDVDTMPGAFTEFTIVLPRTSQFSDQTRGQT